MRTAAVDRRARRKATILWVSCQATYIYSAFESCHRLDVDVDVDVEKNKKTKQNVPIRLRLDVSRSWPFPSSTLSHNILV